MQQNGVKWVKIRENKGEKKRSQEREGKVKGKGRNKRGKSYINIGD